MMAAPPPPAAAIGSAREDALVDRADKAIRRFGLLRGVRRSCLAYMVDANAAPGADDVEVREDSGKCGGDASMEPLLTTLRFYRRQPSRVDLYDAVNDRYRVLRR